MTIAEIVVKEVGKNPRWIKLLIDMSKSKRVKNAIPIADKHENEQWLYYYDDMEDIIYALNKLQLIETSSEWVTGISGRKLYLLFTFPTDLGKLVIEQLVIGQLKLKYNLTSFVILDNPLSST